MLFHTIIYVIPHVLRYEFFCESVNSDKPTQMQRNWCYTAVKSIFALFYVCNYDWKLGKWTFNFDTVQTIS